MSEEVRIGVFVCDCGSNIAAVVNVPDVVEYARNLPGVILADEGKWSCSVDALSAMQDSIREHQINRVVIASCTPRTHEPLFKRTVKEAGINPYLLEFVSIREQVSWVHMHEPEAATAKAKDLVKMGVAKAALLEEGEEIRLPVGIDCLVVGGGMSGMTAALNVAAQGFNAVIVEKEAELGGLLNRLDSVRYGHETIEAVELVEETRAKVTAEPLISVYTGATIESVEGYIGNYTVKVSANGSSKELGISTVIVATGMRESVPEGLFFYHEDPRVKTQIELEGMLRDGGLGAPGSVVMINCVNSKNGSHGCCNIGCSVSVKNAIAIKKQSPDSEVTILYRDLSLVKEEHFQLEEARAHGVRFMRFADDMYPEVTNGRESLAVRVHDVLMDRDFDLPCDLLVLTTGYTGDETVDEIKGHLKVSCDADGFFQERHIKLGPLDFPTSGISLCGCARSPKTLKESCEEALGAAMRASIPMKNGFIEAEGIVAEIDRSLCNDCGLCWKRCPYSAIELDEDKHPRVIKALCKGCGLCAADCPKECITIVHYSDEQIFAQIAAALEESPAEKIIGFVCHWCALGGVDMAGVSRLQYPPNARLIRVMCSARVSIKMIKRAFELGAAGVLVAGCEFPTCHYISGNYAAETRIKRAKRILAKNGFDPEKLWNVWCSAADGPKFAATMRDMVRELGLGEGGN
jgi:heterodisulfide reductase subunit A